MTVLYVLCFWTSFGSCEFECCEESGKDILRVSVTNAPTHACSFLQDLDATTSLALKIKQEPFTASSGQIYGEYTECCLVDEQQAPIEKLHNFRS